MGAAPSALGELDLFSVVTGKEGKGGNPEKVGGRVVLDDSLVAQELAEMKPGPTERGRSGLRN